MHPPAPPIPPPLTHLPTRLATRPTAHPPASSTQTAPPAHRAPTPTKRRRNPSDKVLKLKPCMYTLRAHLVPERVYDGYEATVPIAPAGEQGDDDATPISDQEAGLVSNGDYQPDAATVHFRIDLADFDVRLLRAYAPHPAALNPSLQPYTPVCSPMRTRLQPHAPPPATLSYASAPSPCVPSL